MDSKEFRRRYRLGLPIILVDEIDEIAYDFSVDGIVRVRPKNAKKRSLTGGTFTRKETLPRSNSEMRAIMAGIEITPEEFENY